MRIHLECNKCNTNFSIEFNNKNEDNSYFAVCPNCGNSGYKALKEILLKLSNLEIPLQDVIENLEFNESGFSIEDILNFMKNTADKIKFDCINNNVEWESRTFKDKESTTEQLYLLNIYLDDNDDFTLERNDNTPIEIYCSTSEGAKSFCIRYDD